MQRAASLMRVAVLGRVQLQAQVAPALAWGMARSFAAGSFLDKAAVTDRIITVVKNFSKVDPSKVTPKATFQSELGLDSLDTVEVVMAFEEEFSIEIPDNEADKIMSVADAVEYISSHPSAK